MLLATVASKCSELAWSCLAGAAGRGGAATLVATGLTSTSSRSTEDAQLSSAHMAVHSTRTSTVSTGGTRIRRLRNPLFCGGWIIVLDTPVRSSSTRRLLIPVLSYSRTLGRPVSFPRFPTCSRVQSRGTVLSRIPYRGSRSVLDSAGARTRAPRPEEASAHARIYKTSKSHKAISPGCRRNSSNPAATTAPLPVRRRAATSMGHHVQRHAMAHAVCGY